MWYYDYRMEKDQVPMTVEWSHELNSKGLAKLFMVDAGDAELQQISSNRDTSQDDAAIRGKNGGSYDGNGAAATDASSYSDNGNNASPPPPPPPVRSSEHHRQQPAQQLASFNYEDDEDDDNDLALPMHDMYGIDDGGNDDNGFGAHYTHTPHQQQRSNSTHHTNNELPLPSRRGGAAADAVVVGQSDNLFDEDDEDVLGYPLVSQGTYQPPQSDDDDLIDL
eukprot:TRINITY_DN16166_c0_g1_i2.p1 TRINITY_DN16166_c0_g1~~TRINITY_DN16166_c0_g1_i2.p1  ORF type:complete len:222 (-),score=37.64 TRINITY_DN16166_c0_g1_i2:285-950(-)